MCRSAKTRGRELPRVNFVALDRVNFHTKMLPSVSSLVARAALYQLVCASVFAFICLAGCAVAPISPARPPTSSQQEMKPVPVTVISPLDSPVLTPDTSRGTVVGQVLDLAGQRPISNTIVSLGRVSRAPDGSGVFTLEVGASPSSLTDTAGRFVIKDVPPGEYVLAVGDPVGIRVPSVAMKSPTEVKTFTVQPGVVTEVGVVRVDYLDR